MVLGDVVDGMMKMNDNHYEHIIRNDPCMFRIREYMTNNPLK